MQNIFGDNLMFCDEGEDFNEDVEGEDKTGDRIR